MSFFSDLLKIGGTVGQFIPGGQAWGAGASALGGILGSEEQAKNANKRAGKGRKAAEATSKIQLEALQRLAEIARGFDSNKNTEGAVGYAKDVAGQTLDTSLRGLRTAYGG